MSTPSISSNDRRNSVSAALKNIGQRQAPTIRIDLNGAEESSSIMTYSTLDRIEGTVSITSPQTMSFQNLDIKFIGSARTQVERMSAGAPISSHATAFQQFLTLTLPMRQSDLPPLRTLEAGRTYKFNFLFVVPEHLLPRICDAANKNTVVHQAHLNLPPSMGDRTTAGRGDTLLDDFAPDVASVRYAVTTRIVESSPRPGTETIKTRKVRIVPRMAEQPPIDASGPQSDYILRCEKDVKKNMLMKAKMGTLVAEVSQPRAIELPSPRAVDETDLNTMATVMLRFEPAKPNTPPPRLGTLNTKFKVNTFFTATGRQDFPTKQQTYQWDQQQSVYTQTLGLPPRCLAGVEWTFHPEGEPSTTPVLAHRSVSQDGKHPAPLASGKYNNNGFYTAEVLVPITLPSNKVFVPTFHSCLISRVYNLVISLGIHSVMMDPSIELKVPVQISSLGSTRAERQGSLTTQEAEQQVLQAEEFFVPGTIRAMEGTFPMREERSSVGGMEAEREALPPQYEYEYCPRSTVPGVPVGA